MLIKLSNNNLSFCADTFGARILKLATDKGLNILQFCTSSPKSITPDETGGFPLFPIANRVKGNSYLIDDERIYLPKTSFDKKEYLHGCGWNNEWQVVTQNLNSVHLALNYEHKISGYKLKADLIYELIDNTFMCKLSITCLNKAKRLYGLGFHPYFEIDRDTKLKFLATGFFAEDENNFLCDLSENIPDVFNYSNLKSLAPNYVNHCYKGVSGLILHRGNGLKINMHSNLPYLMMYHVPGKNFIALEPQSHEVDGCNKLGRGGLKFLDEKINKIEGMMIISVDKKSS